MVLIVRILNRCDGFVEEMKPMCCAGCALGVGWNVQMG
jgi:hypothetical protein